MSVTVLVPSALRVEIGGESRLQVGTAGTLDDVMRALGESWPRLARRICDEQGQLRRFVNVYVDGEDVRQLGGMSAAVRDGAEIQVLPSIAGGAR
jgi:molybdopterin converting factor small subunit